MNKKIFTLLVGACISIGSLFTVNAQRNHPYGPKTVDGTAFNDLLTADTVKKLPSTQGHFYLLGVTGLANSADDKTSTGFRDALTATPSSTEQSFVVYVDSTGKEIEYLRIETLAKLDSSYNFAYKGSYKFGAIRRASWCVDYKKLNVSGSNIGYDFTNMHNGLQLQAPYIQNDPQQWVDDGYGNKVYNKSVNIHGKDNLVSSWHFSRTYLPTQELQKGMPLYSYVSKDTVAVFVLATTKYEEVSDERKSGGYYVTVKHVAVNDLINNDNARSVKIGADGIKNVLLFTLKKVNKFVMNADDWNAAEISFDADADTKVKYGNGIGGEYNNPFTDQTLKAVEVNDSLYHYGYMQFQFPAGGSGANKGKFLYVDTAWANYGTDQYLAFSFGPKRDNGTTGGSYSDRLSWGDSFTPWVATGNVKKPDSVVYLTHENGGKWGSSVYWRLDSIIWAIIDSIDIVYPTLLLDASGEAKICSTCGSNYPATGGDFVVTSDLLAKWVEIYAEATALGQTSLCDPSKLSDKKINITRSTSTSVKEGVDYKKRPEMDSRTYTDVINARARYLKDSVNYIATYMKDSIMENQSKFRVVYDPFADSTFINVYQSRVRHNEVNEVPEWWVNSFSQQTRNGKSYFVRPSDSCTNVLYGGDLYQVGGSTQSITAAAAAYYSNVISKMTYKGESRIPNVGVQIGDVYYEGHAVSGNKPDNFHSEMQYYTNSFPSNMDKVMISTADTVVIYKEYESGNKSALAHMYGWSLTSLDQPKYKDSLLYVDIQGLNGKKIITLDQSYKSGAKGLDTKISLNFGKICEEIKDPEDPPLPTINDLYLIRNVKGEFLSVPLWSISDSVYWVNPGLGEDPTRIPSYQWAITSVDGNDGIIGVPFKMVNREFERVVFGYVTVAEGKNVKLNIGGSYANAKFNTVNVNGGFTTVDEALKPGEIDPNNFVAELAKKFKVDEISFIRLGEEVKGDQLLGYKYLDKDATIVDVYAFKYYNGLAMGDDAKFFSWNGYVEDSNDTTVWVKGKNEFDKLYFELQEMTDTEIYPLDDYQYGKQGKIVLTEANTKEGQPNADFAELYKSLTNKDRVYTNVDSVVLERYGYYEASKIKGLKPLARQAYRLFLKDYFYWHPTVKGHYMVPGEDDRYILADQADAVKDYVADKTNNVAGLFGIPHYYFRNTYFNIQESGDDYFAMLQRLDTLRTKQYGGTPFADVYEYFLQRFGSGVAGKLLAKVKESNESALYTVQVDEGSGRLVYPLRGESSMAISTYQLSQDNDPIYRRLHVNEPTGPFRPEIGDNPDTLEFHILNEDKGGLRLYENTGHYKSDDEPIQMTDRKKLLGPCGGRVYNLDANGYYKRDTLGNVISFLGINKEIEYPDENYAIYVDTAYINRGTGWIKPQYMLVVDPYIPEDDAGDYVIGRYLYNTAMYARSVADTVKDRDNELKVSDRKYDITYAFGKVENGYWAKTDNYNKVQPIKLLDNKKKNGEAYRYSNWERFAFTWAIHKGDSLYVLKGVEQLYNDNAGSDPKDLWQQLTAEYGSEGESVDFQKLIDLNKAEEYKEAYYPLGERGSYPELRKYYTYKTMDKVIEEGRTIGLQAVIALDDNTHKDWVFSFRYIQRRASDFVIESETYDRDTKNGGMIRPGHGGWLKTDNGVPSITRSDSKTMMSEAAIFNVNKGSNPVVNESVETVTSKVAVIGGTGSVTILNAAGKRAVISNILGQTVANAKINSDNVSIAVPAGIVVVVIEGGNAVKALVK